MPLLIDLFDGQVIAGIISSPLKLLIPQFVPEYLEMYLRPSHLLRCSIVIGQLQSFCQSDLNYKYLQIKELCNL